MECKEEYCILCFKKTDNYYDLYHGSPTIYEKLILCFPIKNLENIENPVFCAYCYTSLTHAYLVMKEYLHNSNKIEEYLVKNPLEKKKIKVGEIAESFNINPKHIRLIESLRADIEVENTKKSKHKGFKEVEDDVESFEGGIPSQEIIDLSPIQERVQKTPDLEIIQVNSSPESSPNKSEGREKAGARNKACLEGNHNLDLENSNNFTLNNRKRSLDVSFPLPSLSEAEHNDKKDDVNISRKLKCIAIISMNSRVEIGNNQPSLLFPNKINQEVTNTKPSLTKTSTSIDQSSFSESQNCNSIQTSDIENDVINLNSQPIRDFSNRNNLECFYLVNSFGETFNKPQDNNKEEGDSLNKDQANFFEPFNNFDDLGESNEFKYNCRYCRKGFQKMYAFKRHLLNLHYKIKDFDCNICNKVFGTNYELKRHHNTHFEASKVHECKTCCKKFNSNSGLLRHELIHDGVKKYKCETCEKSFADVSTLRQHVKHVHNQIKNHICAHCGNTFAKKNTLTKHMVIHTKQKPHPCNYCDVTYRDKSALNIHIKKSHPEYLTSSQSDLNEEGIRENFTNQETVKKIIFGNNGRKEFNEKSTS